MFSIENISVGFGDRILFDKVSLTINPHDRIGLVGLNGTGKSTLLKIIAGEQTPDSGKLNRASYVSAGYLPQDGIGTQQATLYRAGESAFEGIIELREKLESAQDSIHSMNPDHPEFDKLLEVIGEIQHRMEDLDAYRMKSKIERVLSGLGFKPTDFERPTAEFSGGWQMRIALAKLLLREPTILLLDEPTNHLDLDSLQWLEEYLQTYDGAIILVSHDRAFLDRVTKTTVAIEHRKVQSYSGNYSFYEKESAAQKNLLSGAVKNQQREIAKTQEFIERFRYKATKARQVQSRIKRLEKMELITVETEDSEIAFNFPTPLPSGRIVLQLQEISKSYDSTVVFKNLSMQIDRGDKIAVVGVNGAGKSTLMRIIAGAEEFGSGDRSLGHNVELSYFAQNQAEELDPSKEVLDILDDVAEGEIRKKLRTILGSFLFQGDDVFKKVSVLSGGEKSRLALAKMLLVKSNFLIMDEPTNHLDMKSKRILQDALANFEGTFIIVSHDRAFLDPLVNKVLEVSQSGVRTFIGNVTEYLLTREAGSASKKSVTKTQTDRMDLDVSPLTQRERRRMEAEQREKLSHKLRPLKKKLGELEERIQSGEERKREIEESMADLSFYRDGEKSKSVTSEYKELQVSLSNAYWEWESILKKIESIKKTE